MKKTKRMILKEPFPLNFLGMLAYETNLDLPEEITNDIMSGIKFALSFLSSQEKKLIIYRYQSNKPYTEIATLLSCKKEDIQRLEKRIYIKLRRPIVWNYIRYGIMGNSNRMEEEAYQKGYATGYRCGMQDERLGLIDESGNFDPMKLPISNLRIPLNTLNRLKNAGFSYIGELASLSYEQIENIKNLGPRGKAITAYALYRLGLEHTAWNCY